MEWLESAKTSRARSQRLERWSLELRAYEFDVVYKPGAVNQNADALSRRPVALVAVKPPLETAQITQAQRQDPARWKMNVFLQPQESGRSSPSNVIDRFGHN